MKFESINKETKRLQIRPTKIKDYDSIVGGLKGQLDQQNKFDDEEINLATKYTKDFCKTSIEKLNKNAEDDRAYLFRAYKGLTNEYVGGVIVKTILRGQYHWAEVGYWVLNQHWGNRYGAEMLQHAIDIAFTELEFHRIEAYINLDNIISQKTAERAGMKFECIRKGFINEDDIWTDNKVYVIVKDINNGKNEKV